jgi:Domain of unknown function (DUF1707)
MATRPDLRIGDADRDRAAASLRENYAQGRLSLEEFNERLDAAFAASTQGQLALVTSDLPHVQTPAVPLPVTTSTPRPGSSRGYDHRADGAHHIGGAVAFLCGVALLMFVFMATFDPAGHHNMSLGPPVLVVLVLFAVIRSLSRGAFGGHGGMGSPPHDSRNAHHGHGHGHGHGHHHRHRPGRDGRPW